MLKILAFVIGLCIAAFGVAALLAPSVPLWVARQFIASGAFGFLLIAAIRIAFGALLIGAASASRAPRAVRVLGYVILILGIITGLAGLVAVDWARSSIESWLHQEPIVVRLTGLPLLALGGFVAYACAPAQTD